MRSREPKKKKKYRRAQQLDHRVRIREWTADVELGCSTKQLVRMQRVVCNVKFELEDLLLFLKHIVCINPQGDVTPCLSAHTLPSLRGKIQNVATSSLSDIWNGEVFSKYRGDPLGWMSENEAYARSHARRLDDLGGCRCQAYHLTGDECAMDPADDTSVHHDAFVDRLRRDWETPTDLALLRPRKLHNAD